MGKDRFRFADLHCHPNLKTYGHSFYAEAEDLNDKSHVWHKRKPGRFAKKLNTLIGITKFSQADFNTMSNANVKIAFVSYYPFEKGFFINGQLNGPISAQLASFVTSIGYKRVRYIQKHKDYFADLNNEDQFFKRSCKASNVNGELYRWDFANSYEEVRSILKENNKIAVIPTIEGAHVLNTGLGLYGRSLDESEIFHNIDLLKKWDHPPLFITFAHNFYNDLCGHARSLDPLGPLVNQFPGLNIGFTELGFKVAHKLLEGKPIYLDIKHMSVKSRKQYYELLQHEYQNQIPIIVSHGAITGVDWSGCSNSSLHDTYFCNDDINFYDEELIQIQRSGGLFALQLDGNRLAPKNILKKSLRDIDKPDAIRHSAVIIWRQIQHIAEILDRNNLKAWDTVCIGSDFDGTINPLNGLWTSANFDTLAEHLLVLSDDFLKGNNKLSLKENKEITPEEIVDNFTINNTLDFLRRNFTR